MTTISKLDFNSTVPVYQQLIESIKDYIQSEKLQQDDQLPSRRFWMETLDVGETTVKKAIDKLVADNLLYRRKGKGIFVESSSNKSLRILVLPLFKHFPDNPANSYNVMMSGIFNCFNDENVELISRKVDETSLQNLINNSCIDGIILTAPNMAEADLKLIHSSNIPCVSILKQTNETFRQQISYIDYDNRQGTYDAMNYLIQKGHSKIAILTGQFPSLAHEERLDGYKAALTDNGIPVNEELIIPSWFQLEHGYESTQKLLKKNLSPTAIMTMGDHLAVGAIKALNEHGLSVPEDISVFGFMDLEFALYTTPALTTVKMPLYDMGFKAADMLRQKIAQNNTAFEKFDFAPTLVIRDSVKTV